MTVYAMWMNVHTPDLHLLVPWCNAHAHAHPCNTRMYPGVQPAGGRRERAGPTGVSARWGTGLCVITPSAQSSDRPLPSHTQRSLSARHTLPRHYPRTPVETCPLCRTAAAGGWDGTGGGGHGGMFSLLIRRRQNPPHHRTPSLFGKAPPSPALYSLTLSRNTSLPPPARLPPPGVSYSAYGRRGGEGQRVQGEGGNDQ